jgi:hypothetical protein
VYLHVSDLPVASFFSVLTEITFAYELTQPNNIHESKRMLLACVLTHTSRCIFYCDMCHCCMVVAQLPEYFVLVGVVAELRAERPDSCGGEGGGC